MRAEQTALPLLARATFAAVTTTPCAARSFVRDTARAWSLDSLAESAELVVSELVTNAVKATRSSARRRGDLHDLTPVSIELHLDDALFRIGVRDSSVEQPVLQTADDDAETGRGLLLVEALSVRWDAFLVADGKVTWAELAVPAPEHT